MNTIQRDIPKAKREVGTASKFADGLNRRANSDVPSIAPRSIHEQLTETISLSEQLLDEWNHRLKNNLQILVGFLESGYRKARDAEAREVLSDAIRRIGAIGTAHRAYYYARGNARLMPAKYVRPYSKGQKNDFRDAEAIAEAGQRPTMKFVASKTADQLDLQALHRVRERLVSQRTGIINQIRAFLLERSIAVRQGIRFPPVGFARVRV